MFSSASASFQLDGVKAGAGCDEEGLVVFAAEGAVGGMLGNLDGFRDLAVFRREDLYALAGGGVDVAVFVDNHTVATDVGFPFHRADGVIVIDRKSADFAELAGVGDDDGFFVRGENDAVGHVEFFGDDGHFLRLWIEAVNPLSADFAGLAFEAVGWVGEPNAAIAVNGEIVGRVEFFTVELVDKHGDASVFILADDVASRVLAGEESAFVIE